MDFQYSTELHRGPLLTLIAGLYVLIGIAGGGTIARIKRSTYRKVLSLLRPAESAVRRLIVVAARGLKVEPPASRAATSGRSSSGKGQSEDKNKRKSQRSRPFQLFESPWRIGRGYGVPRPKRSGPEPRIRSLAPDPVPDPTAPVYIDREIGIVLVPPFLREQWAQYAPRPAAAPPPSAPEPDDSVNALSLCRRLAAILDALNDLPRHAERYARWRDKPVEQRRPQRDSALRVGPPPGLRRTGRHEVHWILKECQWLAEESLKPDTS